MKYIFFIFALCFAAVQAHRVRIEKLVRDPAADGRVIQGRPAENGQFPHVVYADVGCTGSLISPEWVLTQANCLVAVILLKVYMGDVDLSLSPVVVGSVSVFFHPEFSPSSLVNDIGLIHLDEPVPISNNIKPIRIPSSGDDLFVGEVAIITGFGYINDNNARPDVLQYANLKVISNEECSEYFQGITDSALCAAGIDSPAQGACFGDGGGGLILRRPDGDVLIGITQYVAPGSCGRPYPSGFVRISHYLDWIKKITGSNFE